MTWYNHNQLNVTTNELTCQRMNELVYVILDMNYELKTWMKAKEIDFHFEKD